MGEPAAHFNFAKDVVEAWGRRTPNAMALWWVGEGGQGETKLTFGQIAERLRRAAAFFDAQGIRRGDRVLVMLPRVPQWWVAMLGLTRLGAVPIPGTPLLTPRDIAYRIKAAGVTAVLTDAAGTQKMGDFSGIRIAIGANHADWKDFDTGVASSSPGFDPAPTLATDPGII